MARGLARLGFSLTGVRQLPDDLAVIADAFGEARAGAELVLATGGLGPTHDDLTREALASALGDELVLDPALEAWLRERFAALGQMPESNLRQAMRIASAEILPNPIGSAPGWWVNRDGVAVALLPGVPSEMRRMFDDQLVPRLTARFAPPPLRIRTIKTFGVGESAVAELVGDLLEQPGEGVTAGVYARDDGVHLRFATRGEGSALDAAATRAREALSEAVWGEDTDDLPTVALAGLGRAGVTTLASWEADTRGALLMLLSAAEPVDGAARYLGGVLDAGGSPAPPVADACLQVSLLPQDAHGRSRVRVALSGSLSLTQRELRIHGSGEQRFRRAAFGALDQVRRLTTA